MRRKVTFDRPPPRTLSRRQEPTAAAFVEAVRAIWPEARVTYLGPRRPRQTPDERHD